MQHVCHDDRFPHLLDAPDDVVEERAGGAGRPRERLAPVRKGGVVFHQGATLHGSGANRSDRWRRAYAAHFGAAGMEFLGERNPLSRYEREGKLADRAYCFKPEYEAHVAAAAAAAAKKGEGL